METWKILGIIGGIFALVAGVVSIATGVPLATKLFGLNLVEGGIVKGMGIIGLIGGLLSLYSSSAGKASLLLLGGILGLLAPCGLSILAVIGGVLGMRS